MGIGNAPGEKPVRNADDTATHPNTAEPQVYFTVQLIDWKQPGPGFCQAFDRSCFETRHQNHISALQINCCRTISPGTLE
ncbi:MAG: hypothetical protein BWY82_02701 [Verrucomicrobia bacterium ADurb.Bin474]|nr:MAG: hypothetical protein BWY82_02701 [Verrucomicrobia bacterium ADurb.Bin474]